MKQIKKNGCSHSYTHWCRSVVGTDKEDYDEIPCKSELKAALIAEQGFICGYTMKRINQDIAHIEHIKPQHICKAEQQGLDLDYNNMIACYPKNNKVKPLYGAHKKDNWWEDGGVDFISPLNHACENYFSFDLGGNITPSNSTASNTIKVLALDNQSLTEDRKRVIIEYIYGPKGTKPISHSEATRLMERVCDRDGRGRWPEFCIAIRDALQEYLKIREKHARKKKYVRRK